ncbi:hypothetical protein E0Z10_g8469 [Xylaria hypoxylon]|uniref:Uncharacterized protein n=1 Tax=Xylaria hypoxylon TaxID=37992 RepID=A0A4Z0YB81_9PEZI|nr:hypothetical protein E0Z10_g8469 [Xylaria hypoxylon]
MSTMAKQLPKAAAPIDLDHQELIETPLDDSKRCHDLHSQMLELIKQLRDDQRDYMSLRRERWGLAHDIPRVAQKVWESGADVWVGHGSNTFWTRAQPGEAFLESVVPNTENLPKAKINFEQWVISSIIGNKDFLVNSGLTEHQIRNNEYWWPGRWGIPYLLRSWDSCCRNTITYASPDSFGDPFRFTEASSGGDKDLPEALRSNRNTCGIIAQFSISRSFDVIDLNNVAAIVSFGGDTDVLGGHIAEWQERSVLDQLDVRTLEIPDNVGGVRNHELPPRRVFMHYMRSFVVGNLNENAMYTKPPTPGLKCLREHITFQGFYDGTMTKLVEKRYSTAIKFLPLQGPAGHFVLVSICDGQEKDVRDMFEVSPGGVSMNTSIPWKKYSIYPAGLYTGLSMFQLQICVFIDTWEQDWTSTIKQIDQMVSLKLNVLDNEKHLRNLVLGNSADASVLYFKVLQFLNNFSDMVRAASSYWDTLSIKVPYGWALHDPFSHSYLYVEDTQNIVAHNWGIVRQRQRDASNRILEKLERTSNEVKSLQSGLFNVQSITEARKSRILNKYLTVFTVVTILFLPPTFVATFFGMHIFDADKIDTTQKIFWVVLGALSGGTYLFAALGLFGSNLSAEERKEWQTNLRESNLVAWLKNIQRRIGAKLYRVTVSGSSLSSQAGSRESADAMTGSSSISQAGIRRSADPSVEDV